MYRARRWTVLTGLILTLASWASGQCLPAVCALTLTLQSDASGVMLGGSGTSTVSMSFGTMQAFGGSAPSGVTKIVGTTNWMVSTPFDIKVTCANLLNLLPCTLALSSSYTLTAQLQSADPTNTWKIGSFTLSSASASTLTSSGTYNQVTPYTFALTIPFTEPPGAISNQVNLVVISN
jgi:hypothetical protein